MAGKIVALWISVTAMMCLFWFGTEGYFSRQTHQATQIRMTARKVLVELLRVKLAESDFERRGILYANFYRTNDCPELARMREALAALRAHALSLSDMTGASEHKSGDQTLALVEEYIRTSATLVTAYRERGSKDIGLYGELQQKSRALRHALLAQGNPTLSVDALDLAAAEESYGSHSGEDEAEDVLAKIRRLKQHAGPDAESLRALIGGYMVAFKEFSAVQRRIGATDYDGIHGDLRNIASELDRLVQGAVDRAARIAEVAHGRYVTVTAIAMLPTFLLGALAFLSFARALNGRIKLLVDATGRVRNGDLTTPISMSSPRAFDTAATQDEVTVLIEGFNEMMSHVAARDHALAQGRLQLAERVAQLQSAEERLREALQRATESDRLKAAFLHNMSHELRTPLNVILGYNSLIADRLAEPMDDYLEPCLEAVGSASKRLLAMVTNIIQLSRLESGTLEMRRESVNLISAVEAVVRDLHPAAAAKQLSLECAIELDEAEVVADEYCVKESIRLLLDNAIKFTMRGKVTLRLHRDTNGTLCLTVRDTGIGIDPSYLPRLFKPFSQEQFDSARAYEGSGVGLALVKRYLAACEAAEISVESEKGKGTAFTIRFPATDAA